MSTKAIPTIPKNAPSPQALSAPAGLSPRDIPTLDDLRRLTAHNERALVRGVDWAFYDQLLKVIGETSGIRLAFDGKNLEIMSPGPQHENVKEFAGRFVETIGDELDIPWMGMASTTWRRPEIARGIEADQCFYFQPAKLAQAAAARRRKSNDVADFPNPDLAIETDLSPFSVDRPGIYAALGVSEIWRFHAAGLTIERLKADGTFGPVEASGFLPIRADEIARWVLEEDTTVARTWKRRLLAWIQAEVAGRPLPTVPPSA